MYKHMSQKKSTWVLGMLIATQMVACGGDDDSGGGSGGGGFSLGEVTDTWSSQCVATFTQDHTAEISLGAREINFEEGQRFLIGEINASADKITLLSLRSEGPHRIFLDAEEDGASFSSNCPNSRFENEVLAGVFRDTDVYRDKEMTVKACTLEAGLVASGLDVESRAAESFIEFEFEPRVYSITLGGLSEHCDGLAQGFVYAQPAEVFDELYSYLMPIEIFMGPAGQ
ncbi:MAG: hypothetical protein ACE366_03005 [Bradymonadia bacterium]